MMATECVNISFHSKMHYASGFHEISDAAEICVLTCFTFPTQDLLLRGNDYLGFLMVYKLINGIFNSVPKFTGSIDTGMTKLCWTKLSDKSLKGSK
jgi:hypothetical protein